MPQSFPPSSVYPAEIDSDYTLYKVYNTTETVISVDNQAWEDQIAIVPVAVGDPEVWADNGFATISGEILYYDAVGRTNDGRVNLLKRCARNMDGTMTRYNTAGTSIRSFVLAEHHNQLAQCLFNLENFVGINFDPRVETLDYRIRHLQATPVIWDDALCPDVTLDFRVVSADPVTGTLANYNVIINGTYNSYRLDFGDGSFTTSSHSGTHTYAPNSIIDPVVTVGNDSCQVTTTQIERTNQQEPTPTETPPFTIPIPEFPPPPPFIFPELGPIDPVIEFPPIVFPCIDFTPFPGINISIGPIDIQVPSVVSFTPINIPSVISVTPLDIPSLVTITPVDIPSIITIVNPPDFSPIGFGPAPFISPIGFAPPPPISPIDINVTVTIDGSGVPSCISMCDSGLVGIDWGTPPTLNVAFVHQLENQRTSARYTQEDLDMMKELGDDYKDFFPDADKNAFEVEYSSLGIPSEITIRAPEFPKIQLDHDLPKEIKIVSGDFDLDGTIRILSPETPIPTEIHVVNNNLPTSIELISDLPSVVRLVHDIPEKIVVETIGKIPDVIRIDGSEIPDQIKVVGVPETIELVFPQKEIKMTIDEDLEVPLVYRGAPIEFKIDMPKSWFSAGEEDDGYPRVKIIPAPCPSR